MIDKLSLLQWIRAKIAELFHRKELVSKSEYERGYEDGFRDGKYEARYLFPTDADGVIRPSCYHHWIDGVCEYCGNVSKP